MPGTGRRHRRDRGIGAEDLLDAETVAAKAASAGVEAPVSGRPPSARSSCCRRSAAGSGCARPRTATRSPASRPGQRGLDARRERAEPNGDHNPGENDGANVCVAAKRPRRPDRADGAHRVDHPLEVETFRKYDGRWAVADRATNSHSLTPTNAVSSRNQGLTSDGQKHADQRDGAGHREQHEFERWAGWAWVDGSSSHRSFGLDGGLEQRGELRRRSRGAIRRRSRRVRTRSGRRSSKRRGCRPFSAGRCPPRGGR